MPKLDNEHQCDSHRKIKISKVLINFEKEIRERNFKRKKYFTPNIEANSLIWDNPLAYLLAVILDQGMKAEKVWEIPFLMRNRLGHLNIDKIANMDEEEIINIFDTAPKLHRFPKTMALRMKGACRLVLDKYSGKTENLWNDNPSSAELHKRFEEFNGVGQKKASMAANILVRDFGICVKDKTGIDISYDIHIRRVFLRAGLVNKDEMRIMVEMARKLNPEYPGILDSPCWEIGRKFCYPNNPDCENCPIDKVCLKNILCLN